MSVATRGDRPLAESTIEPTTTPIVSGETAIAGLASEDNQIRYYAAWWLGKHRVQEACVPLCEALGDEGYRTSHGGYPLRRQAARALGQLQNPEAVPALMAALACDDVQLREAIVQALGAIADTRAIPALMQLLRQGGEQPYEALIETLATLEVWSVRADVEPFLYHDSERVQCAAARYFYLMSREPHYLERIMQTLNHKNPYLRWAAAFDLGAIGHVEAAQAILKAPVANSLKLLNLKRILTAVLEGDRQADGSCDGTRQETSHFLMQAIDDLLIQL